MTTLQNVSLTTTSTTIDSNQTDIPTTSFPDTSLEHDRYINVLSFIICGYKILKILRHLGIFTVLEIHVVVLRVMTPWSDVVGRTPTFQRVMLSPCSGWSRVVLKMEAAWPSETLVSYLPHQYTVLQPRRLRLGNQKKKKKIGQVFVTPMERSATFSEPLSRINEISSSAHQKYEIK
jgi:hypothetical protein